MPAALAMPQSAPVGKKKTLQEQLAELEDPTPTSFDPENVDDLNAHAESDEDDTGAENDDDGGRGHYVAVGKSKLRRNQVLLDDPKYTGAATTRKEFFDDDDEDSLREEDDNMESGSDVDELVDDDSNSDQSMQEESSNSDQEKSGEEFSDESSEDAEEKAAREAARRSELKNLLSKSQLSLAKTISQIAASDIEKGKAVKQQHETVNGLVKARFMLQKALVASNNFDMEDLKGQEGGEDWMGAERASLELWNILTGLRSDLATHLASAASSASLKRKAPDFAAATTPLVATPSTPLSSLLSQMLSLESSLSTHRLPVLEKWHSRTASAAPPATSLLQPVLKTSLSSKLHDDLSSSNSARNLLRTRIARACIPPASSPNIPDPSGRTVYPEIFDDHDFYAGILLKDLMDSKRTDGGGDSSRMLVELTEANRAAKKIKTRVVDTRASKGRKLRYDVHEKLRDFMVPDQEGGARGWWGDRRVDELVKGMFGQRQAGADESGSGSSSDEDADLESWGEEEEDGGALRLFNGVEAT